MPSKKGALAPPIHSQPKTPTARPVLRGVTEDLRTVGQGRQRRHRLPRVPAPGTGDGVPGRVGGGKWPLLNRGTVEFVGQCWTETPIFQGFL